MGNDFQTERSTVAIDMHKGLSAGYEGLLSNEVVEVNSCTNGARDLNLFLLMH